MKKYQLPHYDTVSPRITQAARLGRELRIIAFQEMSVERGAPIDMAIETRLKEWEEGKLQSKISQGDPRVVGDPLSGGPMRDADGEPVNLSEQPDDVFADDPILTFVHAKEYAQMRVADPSYEGICDDSVDAFGMEEFVACHEYNRYGRQVFTLSPVMQEMFMNTDLSRAFVEDIQLPFDCFYVQLEPGSQIPIFHGDRQDEQSRVRDLQFISAFGAGEDVRSDNLLAGIAKMPSEFWSDSGWSKTAPGTREEIEQASKLIALKGSEIPVSGFYVTKTRRPRLHLMPDGTKETINRTQLTLVAVGFSEHFPKGGFPIGSPLRLSWEGPPQDVPGRPGLQARTLTVTGGNPGSNVHQFMRGDYEKYFVGACIDQFDLPEMNLEDFVDLIHNRNLVAIAERHGIDDLMLVGGESTVTSTDPPDSARSTLMRPKEEWDRMRSAALAMVQVSSELNQRLYTPDGDLRPEGDIEIGEGAPSSSFQAPGEASPEREAYHAQAHELSRSLFKMLMALLFYLNSDERSVMEFSSREDRDELEGKIKRSRPRSGKGGKRSSGQNKKEKAQEMLRDMPSANFHHVGYDVDRAIGSQLGYDYEQRRHWRRGHVHRFWTGKLKAENGEEIPREEWADPGNNRKRIKKWVRPTLINPDKEWVECTTRYVQKGDFGAIRDAIDRATFVEGQKEAKVSNEAKRDPKARAKCLAWYGAKCVVCGFEAKGMYEGEEVDGIHVHHLNPLEDSDDGVVTDAVKDLRPLCVPCHQVAHRRKPPYTIQEIKKMVQVQFKRDADGKLRLVYEDDESTLTQ